MNYRKFLKDSMFKVIEFKRLVEAHKSHKRYFKLLKQNNIKILKLSKKQKLQVDEIYNSLSKNFTYSTHELYYSVTGKFDPKIMPEDLFRTKIELKLNEFDSKIVLSDKCYFDLFMSNVRFPDTLVRNIKGCYYDKDYNLINKKAAEEIIGQYDHVVFKPSLENGCGRGVQLVSTAETDALDIAKKDFVIQKVLKQHPSLSALNESSVNVVRLVTFFMNDKVYPITAALRIGGVGDFADNVQHPDGKGMIVIGIDENGKLRENGYYSCGLSTDQTPAGIKFLGYEVPLFEEMKKIATKEHTRFPKTRFIAWDFTVDENNNVIAMEYNMRGPGVLYYQYANGPLFGNLTEELLKYIKSL